MHWRMREWWRRWRGTLPASQDDAAMAEELRFHLDMATQRNVARGMTPAAARRDALMQFGGVERAREAAWDVQRSRPLEDALRDARHALRQLGRAPGFAITALLTLGLGIGACTAILSVLDAVLLRPLPYASPSELVSFAPEQYDAYRTWTAGTQTLASSGAYTYALANVTGGEQPARVWTLAVTSSLLPTLGVAPLLGRAFTLDDDVANAPARVLLRYGFWLTQFGGDTTLVGRTIMVNGRPHEVIGVLPPQLEFPPPARRSDGSMPRTADVWTGMGWLNDLHERGGILSIGRLERGATAAQVAAELSAIRQASAATTERAAVQVRGVNDTVTTPLRPAVLAFTVGVMLVLLIACANLGSMLLARVISRRRELALRVSLGASRGRVVRQLLTESAVLAAGGTIVGIGVAQLVLQVLLASAPPELARVQDATLSARVLFAAIGLAVITALLTGLLPAWRALRHDAGAAFTATRGATLDRGTRRTHTVLVGSEIAFALVLLVGGGLLLRSFAALANVSPGFRSEGLVTADVFLTMDRYRSPSDVLTFFDRLEQRLAAQPGVRAVSAIDRLPYGPSVSGITFQLTGAGAPDRANTPRGLNTAARAGYFRTLGIPMVQGREFTSADAANTARVVVIGRTLAERYWPGRSALGERIVVWGEEREIVGVAGDVRHLGPTTPADPLIYLPHTQDIVVRRMMTVVLRADQPSLWLARLRAEIRALDAQLPISNLRSFGSLRAERTASQRFNALLVASFATLAVLLAAVGIYGVLSFVVAQRTREIGVRMALGASRAAVLRTFLRQASVAVTAGAIAGIAIAVPLSRLMRSLLFGIAPTDLTTYAAVVALVATIALLAAWLPARRAARVQPNLALSGD